MACLHKAVHTTSHLSDHGIEEHLFGRVLPVLLFLPTLGDTGFLTSSGEREGLAWTRLLTGRGHLMSEYVGE